jgi:hypothetical protein
MKTSTSCSCQSAPDLCATGVIERPCYYPGQLLTPAEMTLEQQYFRDKLRRHNRLMHGWGVVCGAAVCLVPDAPAAPAAPATRPGTAPTDQPAPGQPAPANFKPWKVRVSAGYILGPYGDEILIDREQVVDLRTCGQTGVTGGNGEPPDPWCVDVYVQRDPGPLYVAVRYQEVKSRPVRVQPAGCGCDETQCEYSRCRDGYEICVLTDCPPSHANPPALDNLFQGPLPDCPDCPADPWVVLARVEIGADGTITVIDNCSCRRLVVSFGNLWWRCTGDACALGSVVVQGGSVVDPGNDVVINAVAYGLPDKVKASLGAKVRVTGAEVSAAGTRLQVEATVAADAKPGGRSLEIRDAVTDRLIAAKRDVLTIRAAAQAPAPPQGGGTAPPDRPSQPAPPPQPSQPSQPAPPAQPSQPAPPAPPAQPSQPAPPAQPSQPAPPAQPPARPPQGPQLAPSRGKGKAKDK